MIRLLTCLLAIAAFASFTTPNAKTKVKWYTWEEAIAANEKEPRKIMVDLYTHWCGWCKVMDKKTFSDDQVADLLNEKFYPVKFNAEQKEDVAFREHVFKYLEGQKKGRGVHALAYSLLDGKLSYPSVVFLDENVDRITISPGFKEAPDFMKELKFISGEHYKSQTFKEYSKAGR